MRCMSDERVRVEEPWDEPVAVVYDSPHSGSAYPENFGHVLDLSVLRRSEDAHIDRLYAGVTGDGATLVHALFPRAYIDPNRALEDLDIEMIEGAWPHPVSPTPKIRRGAGLIWRQVKNRGLIYDRKLSVAEVEHRIENCWRPYHSALETALDRAAARFGGWVHVNCHSMASMGDETTEDGPVRRPDFVIGDRDGTTCAAGLTETVVETLCARGYSVAVNDPYKGVELVRRYSNPAEGRHSIQIELRRDLYMDEATLERNHRYGETRENLQVLTRAIRSFAMDSFG